MGRQIDFIKDQISNWRALLRIVELDSFKTFCDNLSEEELIELDNLITAGDASQIRLWMRSMGSNRIAKCTSIQLRILASALCIRYYNTISRGRLVYKITMMERNGGNDCKGAINHFMQGIVLQESDSVLRDRASRIRCAFKGAQCCRRNAELAGLDSTDERSIEDLIHTISRGSY